MSKRSRKSRSRSRKIHSIKKIGTLAAAASLAATCEGYADVIEVPVNETIHSYSGYVYYDLNGDGQDDISFFYDTGVSQFTMKGQYLDLPSGTMTAGVLIDLDNPSFLQPYHPCDTILVLPSQSQGTGIFPTGLTDQDPPAFAGFRFFTLEADTISTQHYAWVKANVHSASGDLEILAFGYETEDNVPIPLSCVTGVTDNTPPSPQTLLRNYPNPFNSNTRIDFELPASAAATIRIYDVSGRLVRKIERATASEGINSVMWDGRDEAGRSVVSGIYFYNLEALGNMQSRRMVIIR